MIVNALVWVIIAAWTVITKRNIFLSAGSIAATKPSVQI
jgi:hypothetical protein